MNLNRVIAGVMAAAMTSAMGNAYAAVDDYVFESLQTEVKQGDDIVVAVSLKNKATGEPVSNAVIFARRMDMAPDGMRSMTADLEAMPDTEAGIYRFRTNLAMQGRWQLSLAAKIQGQTGTLQSRLLLKATD